jgi:hypothetical protein
MMDEDWNLLLTFLPENWRETAVSTNALKGLRKAKCPALLLRTLLLHTACGYSLRETVVRAKLAGLAELTDVALMKRLRKSKEWLSTLCVSLFQERGLPIGSQPSQQFRLFDGTTVKEPGKTGSLWRVHYSVLVPSLTCDFFKITATSGVGAGEDLRQYPLQRGDYVIADRGYSRASGVAHVASHGAFLCVRVNTHTLQFQDPEGSPLPLKARLETLTVAGTPGTWPVVVATQQGAVSGRLCVLRKSEEAIRRAHKRRKRRANKVGQKLRKDTLFFEEYVILFTTFPADLYSVAGVLEWYRIRWQVELVFKRFKQLAQLGHLPKYEDESAKAWLYSKLLAALLVEKLIAHAAAFSPWGYDIRPKPEAQKSLA